MRTRRWILLGAMLAGTAWSQEPPAQTDPAVQVRQVWMPALEARSARATARVEAAEAVLAGKGRLEEALPELPQDDWGDPKALDVFLWTLDQHGVTRASELRQLAEYPPELAEELRAALVKTHAVEERADGLRRQVVYGLRSFVQSAPRFSKKGMQVDAPFVIFDPSLTEDGTPTPDLAEKAWSDQRWHTVERQVRQRAVDGVTPVDVDEDLALIRTGAVSDVAHSTAWRLEWVLPHLQAEAQEQVKEALTAWMRGPLTAQQAQRAAEWGRKLGEAQQGEGMPNEVDADAQKEVEAQVERWNRWLGYPSAPGLEDLREESWSAELGIWSLQDRWWDLVGEHESLAGQDISAQAAARAERESNARIKALEGHPASVALTESKIWYAKAKSTVDLFVRENRELKEDWDLQREAQDDNVALATNERDARAATTVYTAMRELADIIQSNLVSRDDEAAELLDKERVRAPDRDNEQLNQWRQEARQLEDKELSGEIMKLLGDLEEAWALEQEPAEQLQAERDIFVEVAVSTLREVETTRSKVRPYVSRSLRAADQGDIFQDAVEEAQMLRIQIRTMARHATDTLVALPSRLLNPATLWNFITSSITTLVLIAMWVFVRRRREEVVRKQVIGSRWAHEHRPMVVQGWLDVFQKTAALVVDLAGLTLLRRSAYNFLSPLGIAVDVVRAGLWWRIIFSVGRWALSRVDEQRQAIFVVSDEAFKLLKSTERWVVTYAMARALVMAILNELIYAQSLKSMTTGLFQLLGILLLLFILTRWEPMLRGRMQRVAKLPGWLQRWVDGQPGRLLRPISSALYIGYLLLAAGWDVLSDTFADRSDLGGLVSVADKMRFSKEARSSEALDDLTKEQKEALLSPPRPESFQVAREEEIEALLEEVEKWRTRRSMGAVMVTGDRGYGKDFFLQLAEPECTVDGRAWSRLEVGQRITSAIAMISCLRSGLELPDGIDDADGLVEALRGIEPRVVVVDALEKAFLRQVGGLDAMRTLLDVVNATSGHHFWVLVMHKPAWNYVSRLGLLLNMGGIRKSIHLHALTGTELRELIMMRTKDAGIEVSFRQLENTGPFGAPPDVERERAISSYFRVVADVSGGSPSIALRLWSASLRKVEDGKYDVVLLSDIATEKLGDVDLLDLFVLMALRQHDGLTVSEMTHVININPTDVRSTVEELQQRGIIHRLDDSQDIWSVRLLKVQSVDLALRRRSVLHWME